MRTEVPVPVVYDGIQLDLAYRLDMLVEESVVVETKAIAKVQPVHEAQLLSHLRLSDRRVGLLINFHVARLKDGIVRLVNELQAFPRRPRKISSRPHDNAGVADEHLV